MRYVDHTMLITECRYCADFAYIQKIRTESVSQEGTWKRGKMTILPGTWPRIQMLFKMDTAISALSTLATSIELKIDLLLLPCCGFAFVALEYG